MPFNLIEDTESAVPISILAGEDALALWLDDRPDRINRWVTACGFNAKAGSVLLIADEEGRMGRVLAGTGDNPPGLWSWAAIAAALPEGNYRIDDILEANEATMAALGWALAGYRFTRYTTAEKNTNPALVWPDACDQDAVIRAVEATYLVRDLVNTPASDMGPRQLAEAAETLANRNGANCRIIVGDDLLEENYPAVHAVGRASDSAPRLIDLQWGDIANPKLTLVGKGVCFDSGGLDLKPASNMKLMKKDMGGAAHVLGLASMVMAAALPIYLRVLIPAVENSVAGNALRPLDIITMRSGKTVEIGNTDAEGRLILADALCAACEEKPDLLIDMATLTGAARVALGPDLPVLFTNNDLLASDLESVAKAEDDPLWRLPLWQPYAKMIDSNVADLNNAAEGGYAGSITASLFLQAFVDDEIPWAHIDLMAWNTTSRPGKPEGGEAMSMRAVFALIEKRFG